MSSAECSQNFFLVNLGDDCLIAAQRLSEWCGKAPTTELDIALINLSIDLFGQADEFYSLFSESSSQFKSADMLAFERDASEFTNCLLVEQPNGDFGRTICKTAIFTTWYCEVLTLLQESRHVTISSIATKFRKEILYHKEFSLHWLDCLGNGTGESRDRIKQGFSWCYRFVEELRIRLDFSDITAKKWTECIDRFECELAKIFAYADFDSETIAQNLHGGRDGAHSEHLTHLLSEMQALHRAHPNVAW